MEFRTYPIAQCVSRLRDLDDQPPAGLQTSDYRSQCSLNRRSIGKVLNCDKGQPEIMGLIGTKVVSMHDLEVFDSAFCSSGAQRVLHRGRYIHARYAFKFRSKCK
jgi:hypothetical protein